LFIAIEFILHSDIIFWIESHERKRPFELTITLIPMCVQ